MGECRLLREVSLEMSEDRYDLDRFLEAQHEAVLHNVRKELRAGEKHTHWMWYIFPQIEGLGRSPMAQRFAIRSLDEARAYAAHPVLGARLRECVSLVLAIPDRSADQIFGFPDDKKLQSCATLFAQTEPKPNLFTELLERFYGGEPDAATLERLRL